MPVVQAIGLGHDMPAPFHLPTLNNRGDVAARLAAIDAMEFDEPDEVSAAGSDAYHGGGHVERSPIREVPGTAPTRWAAGSDGVAGTRDGAAIRGAAAVPPHARILLPEGVEAPGATSYADDDWRRHIKGPGGRTASRVYGPGGSADAGRPPWHAGATGFGGSGSLVGDPPPISPMAGDPRVPGPAFADSFGPTAHSPTRGPERDERLLARHGHETTAESADESAEDDGKPLSTMDKIARIAVVLGIAGIFVVLFIFGPKISQWWSTH